MFSAYSENFVENHYILWFQCCTGRLCRVTFFFSRTNSREGRLLPGMAFDLLSRIGCPQGRACIREISPWGSAERYRAVPSTATSSPASRSRGRFSRLTPPSAWMWPV